MLYSTIAYDSLAPLKICFSLWECGFESRRPHHDVIGTE